MSVLPSLSNAQCRWVEKTAAALSLDARIAQLMHPMLTHYDAAVDQRSLVEKVIKYQVGGAFLFCRPYSQLRDLVQEVLPQMAVPPLFSGDYEAGANTIEEGTRFGSSMAFAAIADLDAACRLARTAGAAAAIQGRAVGARWSFAPVADINFNPESPIVNTRSYGDQVERIRALSVAYLQGMQENGMAACLKHFPGDGVDGRDQHLITTLNSLPMKQWEESFAKTFEAGISAGVYSVMMGHIALQELSGRNPRNGRYLPATLDSRIQRDLLRGRMGFDGLVISDAILMGGARYHAASERELAAWNIAEGSDMVLFINDVEGAIEEVKRWMDTGRIFEDRLEDAVRRVLTLKARLGLMQQDTLPSDEEAEAIFTDGRFSAALSETAERAVTLVRDERGVLPVSWQLGSKVVLYHLPLETTDIPALVVGEQSGKSTPKSALHLAFEARGYQVVTVFEPVAYRREIADANALVYVFFAGPQAGRGSLRLAQRAHQFLDTERILSDFPTVFVSLGSPYLIWELNWLPNFVCTYSRSDSSQAAVARALFGEIPFQGKLPVVLPDLG